ncbi:hypothetical protein BDV96DRAFT_590591 [Lophiotrema nucula]|uniref:Uncharacterized protein n=1 Tax=Lophiotrema nucula TaxID=690887 RepID=A0A6A5YL20_9PLEO|nr:hypothetical protein BDV96DRAFT_590591 [Lophiotrema nucula]
MIKSQVRWSPTRRWSTDNTKTFIICPVFQPRMSTYELREQTREATAGIIEIR